MGPQYQAEVPEFVGNRALLKDVSPKEELVWHPDDMDELTEEEGMSNRRLSAFVLVFVKKRCT